jgi:hypothetical protein
MKTTLKEAIIDAFRYLQGERTITEITACIQLKYGVNRWKSIDTVMADMVPLELGGNENEINEKYKVLARVREATYRLVE